MFFLDLNLLNSNPQKVEVKIIFVSGLERINSEFNRTTSPQPNYH